MRRARTFLRRPKLLCQVGLLLGLARALIAVMPIHRVQKALGVAALIVAPMPKAGEAELTRMAWAVKAISLRVGLTCLPMALAAQALMKRYGYPVCLKIGVKRDGETFSAHAWVESGSEVVVGGPRSFVAGYSALHGLQ